MLKSLLGSDLWIRDVDIEQEYSSFALAFPFLITAGANHTRTKEESTAAYL